MFDNDASPPLDEIIENFAILEDWDDRYRYLIELGRTLAPLPASSHTEANKVRGCASQVWLEPSLVWQGEREPVLVLRGDSDAHIVRGLVALALAIFSGRRAADILSLDAAPVFEQLGLSQHLTQQRSNGVRAMVDRIKAEARLALAAQSKAS